MPLTLVNSIFQINKFKRRSFKSIIPNVQKLHMNGDKCISCGTKRHESLSHGRWYKTSLSLKKGKLSYLNLPLCSPCLHLHSHTSLVATLTLGLQPRQGFIRLHAKKQARESHLVLPRVQKNVRKWTFTLPSELPFWKLESWTFRGKF